MTLNLNANTAATAAIPLSSSTSGATTNPRATNPGVSRRPHDGPPPPSAPKTPESTSAAPAYTISSSASASASASSASSKASDVAGVQPDVDGDGARLMALQVQQELSTQTAPIANASATSILGLFKS